jgi:hypothetical protein
MVERYLPGVTAQDVENAVSRTERAIAALAAEGDEVRYLRSTFVPSEQSVFCLFDAPSVESVREVNLRAGFQIDRIVEVRCLR